MEGNCPRCGTHVAVRLPPGEVCPSCASTEAWDRYGAETLRLDRAAIDEAELRRAGEGGGAGALHLVRSLLPTVFAVAAAAAAVPALFLLLRAVSPGPLADLRTHWIRLARWATFAGALAVVGAAASLFLLKRSRLFRSWPLLSLNLLAAIAGIAALPLGVIHWYGARELFGWEYDAMPALEAAATPLGRAAMEATAVILAPDEDGDMHGLGIGTGAVIGRSKGRAWILTNSHVAIPYLPTGAFRDPAKAHPVWVYLSDGRHGQGKVRWAGEPPLDVVLVSVEIGDAPEPVAVASDAGGVVAGADVFFVPNPFRDGWRMHRGQVVERDPHKTPAGEYGLLLTNLPLQPGDSGSGLFDATGRLVGINTWAILTTDGKPAAIPRGISLPSNVLREIMGLIQDESLDRLDGTR